MLPIQRKIIDYNKYPNANKIEYIVIHDSGNSKPTADALNHYKYFSGGNRGASAHYFIDVNNIIQIIDDKDGSWAVGDGKGKYGIHNKNNISIEMCINDMENIDKVVSHTIDLTVHLMKKYNINIDKVVRHFDCSRKQCPRFMSANNWARWIEFKSMAQAKLKGAENMTEKQVRDIVISEINKVSKEPSEWAKENWLKAMQMGITDGSNPKGFCTREQQVEMMFRFYKAFSK